jgi:hypothetical protein
MRTETAAVRYLCATYVHRDVKRGEQLEIRFGARPDPTAIVAFWLPATAARAVGHTARKRLAETECPVDVAAAVEILHQAAAAHRAVLTPDDIAVDRAIAANQRLTETMLAMNRAGQLHEFNRIYRQEHQAAREAGHGFMSYRAAANRLRDALVPALQVRQGEDPASVVTPGFVTRLLRR